MEILKQIIEQEAKLLSHPNNNLNVTRFSCIKGIEPKVLIDYCLNNNYPAPKLDYSERLSCILNINSVHIHLESKTVKVNTTYTY
jgi:hypothetical protein